jgi:N4-gp56 family major capsid protein
MALVGTNNANAPAGGVAGNQIVGLPQALLDVFSLDILHNAQGIMRFEDFAVRKQELLASPGEVIKFTTYDDITRGGELSENTLLSSQTMSATQKSITVKEWGNAIKVSEKLLRLSWDDVMSEAATLLGRDYGVVRDLALRDALFNGVSSAITAGNLGQEHNFDTDATAGVNPGNIGATETFDIESIRKAVEILQTQNAPKFFGDYYVCFVHPHQAAYLRRDQDWINAHQYVGTRNLFNGEIGRWEDVIFIVTTHAPNGVGSATTNVGYDATLDAAGDSGIDLYKACVFGDQCLYVADSLPVELRDNGVEDFGRTHGLAWYSIFGVECLKPEYAVTITSA